MFSFSSILQCLRVSLAFDWGTATLVNSPCRWGGDTIGLWKDLVWLDLNSLCFCEKFRKRTYKFINTDHSDNNMYFVLVYNKKFKKRDIIGLLETKTARAVFYYQLVLLILKLLFYLNKRFSKKVWSAWHFRPSVYF